MSNHAKRWVAKWWDKACFLVLWFTSVEVILWMLTKKYFSYNLFCTLIIYFASIVEACESTFWKQKLLVLFWKMPKLPLTDRHPTDLLVISNPSGTSWNLYTKFHPHRWRSYVDKHLYRRITYVKFIYSKLFGFRWQ